jgi:predicted transcriptional regulator
MKTRDQIFPYLTPALRKRLRLYASRRGSTESSVVERALIDYLDGDVTDRALILRRLDRQSRGLTTVQRDVELLAQGFGLFVQLWFAHTPRIADDYRAAAEKEALRRYSQFLDHVVSEIAAGRRFARDESSDEPDDPEPSDERSKK